jgi:D-alanine-D-alanine ligase
MNDSLRIAVLFGGPSPEHDVSVLTTMEVVPHLRRLGHAVLPVYVSPQREWLSGEALTDVRTFRSPAALAAVPRVRLVTGDGPPRLVRADGHAEPFDLAFPIFHGSPGEDGTVQGLLAFLGVPFVGPDHLCSVVGIDKVFQKKVLAGSGIPVIDSVDFALDEWRADPKAMAGLCRERLGLPLIIKPARLGSSIGIQVVREDAALIPAIEEALTYDEKILVERFCTGALEINCAVARGRETLYVSECERPIATGEFLSFADKYMPGSAKGGAKGAKVASSGGPGMSSAARSRVLPADIDAELTRQVKETAVRAYRAIDGAGVARVDFLIVGGRVCVNEINTIPGSLGLYLWEPTAVSPTAMLQDVIEAALDADRRRRALRHVGPRLLG